MKFITKNDLNLVLSETLINQALSDCNDIDKELSRAEDKALEEVKQWLNQRYDIEFELRPYTIFEINKEYNSLDRVLLTANTENKKFAQQNQLDIIFSANNSFVYALKDVDCPKTTATTYYSQYSNNLITPSRYPSNYTPNYSYTSPNPNYSATCGIFLYKAVEGGGTITEDEYNIWLTGGTIGYTIIDKTFSFNKKVNKYKTKYIQIASASTYNSSADTWSPLYSSTSINFDYESLVSDLTPTDFYENISYFDQYLEPNLESEWVDDRNATLIDIVASMTVYHLIRRISPRMMSQTISDMFDLSLENLKLFNKGTKQINIKLKDGANQRQLGSSIVWGQNFTTWINNY